MCTISLSLSPLSTHKINPLFSLNVIKHTLHYLVMDKTHINLFIFTISPIHGPDSQQPIVTATEKRKSSTLMLLPRDCLSLLTGSVTTICSKCLITITPHQSSLYCRQSSAFLSCSPVFLMPLSLAPPPFLHIF